MATISLLPCCSLAQKPNDESYNNLKHLLLENIWSYFSVDGSKKETSLVQRDDMAEVSSCLISASFSGCTAALDFILDFNSLILGDLPDDEIINARLPCHFPVPDTWIHKTVCLAVSPLHMACWRLNLAMIQKLLSLGADPNSLAWERFGSDVTGNLGMFSAGHAASAVLGSSQEDHFSTSAHDIYQGNNTCVTIQGLEFDPVLGFSPLHFIALGLRSPPRNSLLKGSENGLIHKICVDEDSLLHQSSMLRLQDVSSLFQSVRELYPWQTLEESDVTSDIVECCLKVLLGAGANPNIGRASYLNFYFPLDIIIQPPIRIYYASNMARSTQTSESLRRQNFEESLYPITNACRTLLHEGAKLSDEFLSGHRWSLRLLDCFYTNRPRSVFSLIELLMFSGIFPDNGYILDQLGDNFERTYTIINMESMCTKRDITKFIADAINVPVPESLVALVLKWCSMNVLHHIIQTSKAILAKSEYSLPYLLDLIGLATNEQLRPLKHLCKLIVLRSIKCKLENIELLPLPSPLLRDLRVIRHVA